MTSTQTSAETSLPDVLEERLAKFNERYADDKTWYFIKEDCESYQFSTIADAGINSFKVEFRKIRWKKASGSTTIPILSPRGNSITRHMVFTKEPDLEREILYCKSYCFDDLPVDKSKTAGDNICGLTQEPFENPVILMISGRTYSKHAMLQHMESTLFQDENLRLEDITLMPSMLDAPYSRGIELYPNYTFSERPDEGNEVEPTIVDASRLVYKPYDQALALSKNIPAISALIEAEKTNKEPVWNYEKIWSEYATARGLDPAWQNHNVTLENLVFENNTFFYKHPKCCGGHIHFKNCLITNSVFNEWCHCGVTFKTCLFRACTFDYTGKSKSGKGGDPRFPRSRYINCIFKVASSNSTKGIFPLSRFDEESESDLELLDSISCHVIKSLNDCVDCYIHLT